MFQIETEDMLPRMAPKPSDNTAMCLDEAAIRPQVPEVSLLFGQQTIQQVQQHHQTPPPPAAPQPPPQSINSPITTTTPTAITTDKTAETVAIQQPLQQQTYAAWKKKMMPKMSYPSCQTEIQPSPLQIIEPSTANLQCNHFAPSTKIYPIRQTCVNVPLLPLAHTAHNNANHPIHCYTTPAGYHHNNENGNIYGQVMNTQPVLNRKSQSLELNTDCLPSKNDILTICAGTQTDAIALPTSNASSRCCLMDKANAEEFFQMLQEIRGEQIRMMEIIKTLLMNQQQQATYQQSLMKDAFSQTEEVISSDDNYKIEEVQNLQPPMEIENKFLNHLIPKSSCTAFLTPKTKPAAQSTGYRPNSPQTNQIVEQINANNLGYLAKNSPILLPPASSEKSMLMNELALKYLPNEKLTKLLQELNINVPYVNDVKDDPHHIHITPNIENFNKSPGDISRASYKYLKKYRLLPEDGNGQMETQQLLIEEYDTHIGHLSPAFKTKSSPYHGTAAIVRQHPAAMTKANILSPSTSTASSSGSGSGTGSSSSQANTDDRIDLDDIKQQAKYL